MAIHRNRLAEGKQMSAEMAVVTCYFNPSRYETKRVNFERFVKGIEAAGADLVVAELAFADAPFELPAGDRVLQLRGSGIMWQKERLLNIAIERLPEACRKIAWVDCDVLFENQNWLDETSKALEQFVVVQPFSGAVRLARGRLRRTERDIVVPSFAKVYSLAPAIARTGTAIEHGDTGLAWAARREFFDGCGLYDVSLTGSGDHLMAHAFVGGMLPSPCLRWRFQRQRAYALHFLEWAKRAQEIVGAQVGAIEGNLLHLWHGDMKDRRYTQVIKEFAAFNFNPERDLQLDESGLWTWKQASPELRSWAENMFRVRKEDGRTELREDTVTG
jgi:hypothetical protein